ncbi:MAG: hypothetical protein R2822_12835 [Spirosomataceae bacterium]
MLSIVGLFYRNFGFFTQAVAWGGWLLAGVPVGEAFWSFIAPLFWLKVASFGVVWYFMQTFSRQVYIFYQNLGYSIPLLFIGAFGLDMILFFGLMALIEWIILLF